MNEQTLKDELMIEKIKLAQIKDADGKYRFQEERDWVLEQHMGLIVKFAKQFHNTVVRNDGSVIPGWKAFGYEWEDTLNLAIVTFLKYLDKFDPDRGIKLITYFYYAATKDLKYGNGNTSKKKSPIDSYVLPSFDYLDGEGDDSYLYAMLDMVYGSQSLNQDEGNASELLESNALSEKEKQILKYMYEEQLTQVEISDILGISQQGVSYLQKSALNKLRKAMK